MCVVNSIFFSKHFACANSQIGSFKHFFFARTYVTSREQPKWIESFMHALVCPYAKSNLVFQRIKEIIKEKKNEVGKKLAKTRLKTKNSVS